MNYTGYLIIDVSRSRCTSHGWEGVRLGRAG